MSTTLQLLHSNVCADRYDYGRTWPKRRPSFEAKVKAHSPHLVTLTECQAPAAVLLAAHLGLHSWSFQGSSVLYNPRVLKPSRLLAEKRWLTGSQTHSLLAVELEVIATGKTFNVLVSHLPPFVTRTKLRRTQQAWINTLTKGWHDPTVLATDANWSKTFESTNRDSWASARLTAAHIRRADYRTSGGKYGPGNPIDYVLGRHGARFASYDVLDGRKWSDHNGLLVQVTL